MCFPSGGQSIFGTKRLWPTVCGHACQRSARRVAASRRFHDQEAGQVTGLWLAVMWSVFHTLGGWIEFEVPALARRGVSVRTKVGAALRIQQARWMIWR